MTGWRGRMRWRRRRRWPRRCRLVGFDLVIFGSESTDARTGMVPAMVAERLGVPQLTLASKVDISGSAVTIRRVTDDGYRW